jgi:hypothetical protein
MQVNSEFIDRIIIAAEKEIQGKQMVNVSVVENLIETLRTINNASAIHAIDSTIVDNQHLLNYD